MVIEEAERRAGREGVQPQRDLGQLDRHRVAVHAVDASFEHDTPDEAPVVESIGGRPSSRGLLALSIIVWRTSSIRLVSGEA